MISRENLKVVYNRARIQLVEHIAPMVSHLIDQVGRTVDLEAWRLAPTLRDRLGAISWLRAGVGAGTLAAVGGLMFVLFADRPDVYPPPEPTARQIALHQKSVRLAKATPPPSLVEANKSWKAE
jgi:hypothetical protein